MIFQNEVKRIQVAAYNGAHTVISDAGTGGGGPLAPQYFADQLTLFKPGRAHYPHLLLLSLPNVYPCFGIAVLVESMKHILYVIVK